MITILAANSIAIIAASAVPNDFLAWHSYLFFGLQITTLLPNLFKRTKYLKDAFLPSLFVLSYFLVTQVLGAYLVPREFGHNKDFADVLVNIKHYNVIIPYLMLTNVGLFLVTRAALASMYTPWGKIGIIERRDQPIASNIEPIVGTVLYFCAFFLTSYFDVYSVFAFQLAIMILHLTSSYVRSAVIRYVAYAFYIVVLLNYSFENKREIAMALFLVVFLEANLQNVRLNLSVRSVLICFAAVISFFLIILTASILRGYGDFPVSTALGAVLFIPEYMSSNIFVDGITDNLELNYSYGSSLASIDLLLDGRLNFQYGASLLKLFFLPIPREIFPEKPESVMQLFTREYAPSWWDVGGSLPVVVPSEMFINFHYAGIFVTSLTFAAVNSLFVNYNRTQRRSFFRLSSLFLFISVLTFARGSGIEQYVLYFLIAAPFFAAREVIATSFSPPLSRH